MLTADYQPRSYAAFHVTEVLEQCPECASSTGNRTVYRAREAPGADQKRIGIKVGTGVPAGIAVEQRVEIVHRAHLARLLAWRALVHAAKNRRQMDYDYHRRCRRHNRRFDVDEGAQKHF